MINKPEVGVEALQMVLDSMKSIVYVTEADTYEIIFANKFAKSMFGDDVEGKKCWNAFSPFSGPCPWCRLNDALAKPLGEPLIWEDRNEGMNAVLNVTQTITRWPDGRKAHIAVLSDITEIKRNETSLKEYKDKLEVMLAEKTESEQALRQYKDKLETLLVEKTESEQTLKAMSDNLPGSFVFQLREEPGREIPSIVYISKGVGTICNITPERLGSDIMPLLSLFHPDDLALLQRSAVKRETFTIEARLNVPGKEDTVWLSFSEIPRENHLGETVWDGIAIDISTRKRMEAELQRSQQELLKNAAFMKEISDNMADSAVYRTHLGRDGKIRLDYASSQMEKIAGAPIDKLKESLNYFSENVHSDDIVELRTRVKAAALTPDAESVEFRYIRDGKTYWYRIQSSGYEHEGHIYRDGLLIDITEQKQLEQQLINARNKAEESDRLKSTFMANMSHEIRTPMNAIIGFLEFMINEDDMPAGEQKEYMRIVSSNANQLLKLIGDILDISKIDAGQMQIRPEQTDVNVMLRDIRSSFMASGAMSTDKQTELIVDESGQDKTGLFILDSARLRQILNNLVGNAIKFTDRGHVRFGYRMEGEILHFFVEDTGIGISKEKLADLGKPFQQLHDVSVASKYGGTGIGLAISINLVKLMGGAFSVSSEPGKGSLFQFTIPAVRSYPDSLS